MEQLTLFQLHWGTVPPPDPPHSGPKTSQQAAAEITTVAGRLRTQVYEFIVSRGEVGATDCEIQLGLELSGNSQRPRRRELVQGLLVRDSGRTRPTPAGRQAVVWVSMGDCVIAKPDAPRL